MALTIGVQKAREGTPLTQEELADFATVQDWKEESERIGRDKGWLLEQLTSLERANSFIVKSWDRHMKLEVSRSVRRENRLNKEELDNLRILEGLALFWWFKGIEKRELGFAPTQEEQYNPHFMKGFNSLGILDDTTAAEVNNKVADARCGRDMAERGVPRVALTAQERNNPNFMNGFNSYLEERKVA